jgi:type VI secretion system secreted protein Hcp
MKKVTFVIGVLISVFIVNPAFAQSPFNYFLMISGIPGESQDQRHLNWIELISFKEGMSQPGVASRSVGGAASATRVQMADLTITKRVDKASVVLRKNCSSGQQIKEAYLSCVYKTGMQQEIFNIKLENFIVSGVKLNADSLGFWEEITLSYSKIEWKYTGVDPKTGKPIGEVKAAYDVIANRTY